MKENNLNMGEVTAATISPFLTALNAVVCINYDAHWSMLKLQYIWKKTKLHRPTGFDMHPYQGQETLSVTKDTGITVHIVIQLSKVDAHQRQRSQRRCPKYYKCLSKNQMTLEFDLHTRNPLNKLAVNNLKTPFRHLKQFKREITGNEATSGYTNFLNR